ncbi:MAG TPA: lysophospholipid acyltransferase family protein [Candidatus Paceibacterota bacterium]|jgi:1-acyl-sn-glycerol-3-phosphate acyltransferase|nr:lysophospholipid acyltransferase family protein [Candidatus Paceibacterota bacterium]HJN62784.1 lysophospholipid acyltransferase family protein [Candidatus Paceibacterota bacterium]|tara:strand:- start:23060 stop:23644 length:585 start_codon:yes stop_codon:yes gene_type:complete
MEGLENLKKQKGNFILASNHISEIDSGLIPSTIPIRIFNRPIFFASLEKREYSHKGLRGKLFYGGLLFHLLGARKVYKGLDDYSISVGNHVKLLEEEGNILIFPEGRVSCNGKPGGTGGGIAFLVYRTKKPIIPIKLEGIWGMLFREFISRKRFLKMKIGQPIYYEDLFDDSFEPTKENFKAVSRKVLEKICGL